MGFPQGRTINFSGGHSEQSMHTSFNSFLQVYFDPPILYPHTLNKGIRHLKYSQRPVLSPGVSQQMRIIKSL